MSKENPYKSPTDAVDRSDESDSNYKKLYLQLFSHLSISKQIVFWLIILGWIVLAVFSIAAEYAGN